MESSGLIDPQRSSLRELHPNCTMNLGESPHVKCGDSRARANVRQLAWSSKEGTRWSSGLRLAYGYPWRVRGSQERWQALKDRFVAEMRAIRKNEPRPARLRNGCLKCLPWGVRGDPGTFGPDGSWVDSWITLSEPAVAIVDPNPDRGKRPGARNDQIQVPIAIHVARDNTHSAFLGGDGERTRTNPSGESEFNSILEGVRTPTL